MALPPPLPVRDPDPAVEAFPVELRQLHPSPVRVQEPALEVRLGDRPLPVVLAPPHVTVVELLPLLPALPDVAPVLDEGDHRVRLGPVVRDRLPHHLGDHEPVPG